MEISVHCHDPDAINPGTVPPELIKQGTSWFSDPMWTL